eukprot:m.283731 g.283731  ORF g.283731 m.283731 type:complete len:162 (+) comp54954_c0_seq6:539-1024(+)
MQPITAERCECVCCSMLAPAPQSSTKRGGRLLLLLVSRVMAKSSLLSRNTSVCVLLSNSSSLQPASLLQYKRSKKTRGIWWRESRVQAKHSLWIRSRVSLGLTRKVLRKQTLKSTDFLSQTDAVQNLPNASESAGRAETQADCPQPAMNLALTDEDLLLND